MSVTAQQVADRIAANRIRPEIGSWSDLSDIPTKGLQLPVLCAWIETATGVVHLVRLIESTQPSDPDNGIQRPRDFDLAYNPRVWFAAG